MKIMVFGDSASGKSTFSETLGEKLKIPVIHLDSEMERIGRHNKQEIKEFIEHKIQDAHWIIEGNAFTKDQSARIKAADHIFVFKSSPLNTFLKHLLRWFKIKFNLQKRKGSQNTHLNLAYFIPYIFIHFPKRRNMAIQLARKLQKDITEIHSYLEADKKLHELLKNSL